MKLVGEAIAVAMAKIILTIWMEKTLDGENVFGAVDPVSGHLSIGKRQPQDNYRTINQSYQPTVYRSGVNGFDPHSGSVL
ncbi:hypothetical protein DPMN_103201 [Dreissena polymorpha]|uniref:Uncharacterized protein n=1 Tax=Dreissena polymorpha TaxID=45954 RepID=A0A9D4K2K1_DREPO|nr:hypothetical protein DPMN_103201 [Dreissena polymorpha]